MKRVTIISSEYNNGHRTKRLRCQSPPPPSFKLSATLDVDLFNLATMWVATRQVDGPECRFDTLFNPRALSIYSEEEIRSGKKFLDTGKGYEAFIEILKRDFYMTDEIINRGMGDIHSYVDLYADFLEESSSSNMKDLIQSLKQLSTKSTPKLN